MNVRLFRLYSLILVALLFAAATVSAQSVPPRVVQTGNGSLYLIADGAKRLVTPAVISDADLAAIPNADAPVLAAGAPQAITVQSVLVAPIGSDHQYVTVAALVQNPNPGLWMPTESYTATAYDAAGTVIGSYDNVLSLGAGETRWVVVHQMTAPGQVSRVDFQIRQTKSMQPAATDPAPFVSIVQSSFQPDAVISKQVGQVHNDGSVEVPQARVDVVYFDAHGGLLGTSFTYVSHLKPGETVSFSATSFGRISQATDIKTFATAELLR